MLRICFCFSAYVDAIVVPLAFFLNCTGKYFSLFVLILSGTTYIIQLFQYEYTNENVNGCRVLHGTVYTLWQGQAGEVLDIVKDVSVPKRCWGCNEYAAITLLHTMVKLRKPIGCSRTSMIDCTLRSPVIWDSDIHCSSASTNRQYPDTVQSHIWPDRVNNLTLQYYNSSIVTTTLIHNIVCIL